MGSKRKTPGINGSSSADIAFMLLIFFLITTSMDTDKGLARRLPPPVPKDQKKNDVDVNKRNLVVVLINSSNQILFNGEPTDIKQLKDKVKEFIDNPYNDANKPEKVEEDVPFFGKVMTAKKHVISLQNGGNKIDIPNGAFDKIVESMKSHLTTLVELSGERETDFLQNWKQEPDIDTLELSVPEHIKILLEDDNSNPIPYLKPF